MTTGLRLAHAYPPAARKTLDHMDAPLTTSGTRSLLATIGTWLAVAGALAIIVGSGPSAALVRIGLAVGVTGVLLAWPGWHRLPGLPLSLALLAWGMVSIRWAGYADPAHVSGSPMALVAPLALAVGMVAWRGPAARLLDMAVVGWCLLTFLLVVVQLAVGWDSTDGTRLHIQSTGLRWTKATGFFDNHTHTGLLFTVLAVLAASTRGREHLHPAVRWAAVAIGIVGVAFSTSRTCFVGMIAGLFIVLIRPGRHWWPLGLGIGTLVLAFIALTYATRPEVVTKTLKFQDGRAVLWNVGLTIAKEHPLLGAGGDRRTILAAQEVFPRLYPDQAPEFKDVLPEPHSTYIGYAAFFGFPALALWLAMLGTILYAVICYGGRDRALAIALLLGFTAAAVGCMINQGVVIAPFFHLLLGSCLARLAMPAETSDRPAGAAAT